MRIIAGQWRGTPLTPPPTAATRPILDHVKEALFNILGAQLAHPGTMPPCTVLDLFSGTGSIGLEALSRGARHCVFVERQRATVRALTENIERLQAAEMCTILQHNAYRLAPASALPRAPYDVVFCDPPYVDVDFGPPGAPIRKLLRALGRPDILAAEGLLVLRHPRRAVCPDEPFDAADLVDRRTYGDMTLSFFVVHRRFPE